jgi:hypothetical protein
MASSTGTYLDRQSREGLVVFALSKVIKRALKTELAEEYLVAMEGAGRAARSCLKRMFPVEEMHVLSKYGLVSMVTMVQLAGPLWVPMIPDPKRLLQHWDEFGEFKHIPGPTRKEVLVGEELASFLTPEELDRIQGVFDWTPAEEGVHPGFSRIETMTIDGYDFPITPTCIMLDNVPDYLEVLHGVPIPSKEAVNISADLFYDLYHGPELGAQWSTHRGYHSMRFTEEEEAAVKKFRLVYGDLAADIDKFFCAYKALIHKKRTFEDLIKVWPEAAEYVANEHMTLKEGCPMMNVREAEALVSQDLAGTAA